MKVRNPDGPTNPRPGVARHGGMKDHAFLLFFSFALSGLGTLLNLQRRQTGATQLAIESVEFGRLQLVPILADTGKFLLGGA